MFSFLKGAIVGAVLGVLFAPKSGKETRQDIVNKFEESKDVAADYAEKAKVKGEEMQHAAEEATENIKITLSKTANDLKDQLHSASEEIRKEAQDLKAEVADSAETIADEAQDAAKNAADDIKDAADDVKDEAEDAAQNA